MAAPAEPVEYAPPLMAIRQRLLKHEGRVRHMYRDSKGKVTVGIGFLLATQSQVTELSWQLKQGRRVVPSAVAVAEWNYVRGALPSGKTPEFYGTKTRVELSDATIDRVFTSKLLRLHRDLIQEFTIAGIAFEHLPPPVQEAMFDMGWNLGAAFINKRTADGELGDDGERKRVWPKLREALLNQDWEAAARESHRAWPVPERRNMETSDLILRAIGYPLVRNPDIDAWRLK